MKSRAEVAGFINHQLKFGSQAEKGMCWHYGRQDLRELMDFIYSGPPSLDSEEILPYKFEDKS